VYEIVKAVIHLAKQFDKVLVAEGVETQAQHQTLKDMGCPIAQGFLFGKAVPL
jgi:EAL domain-containing protein (putative c-di-GMP-specific phosphodiesterase class I)